MKKKLTILILTLVCVCALCACGDLPDPERDAINDGAVIKVTLDLVGGNSSGKDVRYVRLYENTPIALPWDYNKDINAPTKTGFIVEGWYTGEKDADGNVTYKEKWDFSQKVNSETHGTEITLYAKWQPRFYYNVLDIESGEAVQKVFCAEGATFNSSRVVRTGYTLIDYYADANRNNKWDFAFTHPGFPEGVTIETATEEDYAVNVYGYFLEGEYVKVVTAEDFLKSSASNFYLVGDENGVIDCSSLTNWTNNMFFRGSVIGNGVTVKGLTVQRKNRTFRGVSALGLFADELENATISDVTFEDCTLEIVYTEQVRVTGVIGVGFLGGVATGTKIENVTFTNCAIDISVALDNGTPVVSIVYDESPLLLWGKREDDETNGNTVTNVTGSIAVQYSEN